MAGWSILKAPSILGLRPAGVERLPGALLDAGLAEALAADRAGRVAPEDAYVPGEELVLVQQSSTPAPGTPLLPPGEARAILLPGDLPI